MLFDESRKSSQVFRSIETSGKPWAAAINGLALGGAFELTLACHYRVAADNPKTGSGCPKSRSAVSRCRGTQRVATYRPAAGCDAIAVQGRGDQSRQGQGAEMVNAVVPAADLIKSAKD